jgi:hypothetical protein
VALIGKTRAYCNLREAGSPVTYQCCCALQSKVHDVTVRRYSDRSSEHPSEMKWTAPCYATIYPFRPLASKAISLIVPMF